MQPPLRSMPPREATSLPISKAFSAEAEFGSAAADPRTATLNSRSDSMLILHSDRRYPAIDVDPYDRPAPNEDMRKAESDPVVLKIGLDNIPSKRIHFAGHVSPGANSNS